jgi:hypothetical protein
MQALSAVVFGRMKEKGAHHGQDSARLQVAVQLSHIDRGPAHDQSTLRPGPRVYRPASNCNNGYHTPVKDNNCMIVQWISLERARHDHISRKRASYYFARILHALEPLVTGHMPINSIMLQLLCRMHAVVYFNFLPVKFLDPPRRGRIWTAVANVGATEHMLRIMQPGVLIRRRQRRRPTL